MQGSGKTRFNRGKARGESWCVRREQAIKEGSFKRPEPKKEKKKE